MRKFHRESAIPRKHKQMCGMPTPEAVNLANKTRLLLDHMLQHNFQKEKAHHHHP